MQFLYYPKCSTCQKAKRWLEDKGLSFNARDITLENPTCEELRQWHQQSGLPLRRFFNTSGMLYRSMGLKDRLGSMSDEAQYQLLATDGMLVKRPVLVGEHGILLGFQEADWETQLLH